MDHQALKLLPVAVGVVFSVLKGSLAAQVCQNELSQKACCGNGERFWTDSSQTGGFLRLLIPPEYAVLAILLLVFGMLLGGLITASVLTYWRPMVSANSYNNHGDREDWANKPRPTREDPNKNSNDLGHEPARRNNAKNKDGKSKDQSKDTTTKGKRQTRLANGSGRKCLQEKKTPLQHRKPVPRHRAMMFQPPRDHEPEDNVEYRRLRASGQAQQVPVANEATESSAASYISENIVNLNYYAMEFWSAPEEERSDQIDTDNSIEKDIPDEQGGDRDDMELLLESSLDLRAQQVDYDDDENSSPVSIRNESGSADDGDDDQVVPGPLVLHNFSSN